MDSIKRPNSKVSNAENIVKLAFELSNMGGEVELDFDNKMRKKLDNKLIKRIEIKIIYIAFIDPFCLLFCLNIFSKIVNTMTLKLSDVYLFVNFETIL